MDDTFLLFHFFKEICEIPHGSQHCGKIADYLEAFAKEHNLQYTRDKADNMVIKKAATEGYENKPVVILQGHMDMVCEKNADCKHDFLSQGLELVEEDGFLYAKGTTLGADDGIAIAYMLAILHSETIEHGPLEMLITSDEEIGMIGAAALDTNLLTGKQIINLDNEDEGIIIAGCAGGTTVCGDLAFDTKKVEGTSYCIRIRGLQGGHSGNDIDKNRTNAIKLTGRLLYSLGRKVRIISAFSGSKDNVIPCESEICVLSENNDEFEQCMETLATNVSEELKSSEPSLIIEWKKIGDGIAKTLTRPSQDDLLLLLNLMPYGIMSMSNELSGVVETSANPGILNLDGKKGELVVSVRSMKDTAKKYTANCVRLLMKSTGAVPQEKGIYPGWKYQPDSSLIKLAKETYDKLFEDKAKIEAIHAGLECGIFAKRIKNAQIISIGPNIYDVHTSREKLDIKSTKKIFDYLLSILKNI